MTVGVVHDPDRHDGERQRGQLAAAPEEGLVRRRERERLHPRPLGEVGDIARLRERQHRLEPAGARRDVEDVGAVAALQLRAQRVRVRRPDRQIRRIDLDVGVQLLEPVEDRLQLWVALPVGLGEDLDRRRLVDPALAMLAPAASATTATAASASPYGRHPRRGARVTASMA